MPTEKIYDFGMLGKWSEKTLLEQAHISFRYTSGNEYYAVKRIENEFDERKKIQKDCLEYHLSKRIWIYAEMRTIQENIIHIDRHNKKIRELNDAFQKYIDAMTHLSYKHLNKEITDGKRS